MESLIGRRIGVLDDGFVEVVDCMGDDAAIVQAARVLYAEDGESPGARARFCGRVGIAGVLRWRRSGR